VNLREHALKVISNSVCKFKLQDQKAGIRVLIYHSIGSQAYGDTRMLSTLSKSQFINHLNMLEDITVLPLHTMECFSNSVSGIVLTFDDGYIDNLTVAAPLLIEKKMPFTVFVVGDFIRKSKNGFLSPLMLKELSKMPGVTIGSHGMTHVDLRRLNKSDLTAELRDSKKYLEDLLGIPVDKISYPYGGTNITVMNAATKAGYKIGCSSRFDINSFDRYRMMLNRCAILSYDTNKILYQKLQGCWDWYKYRHRDPLYIK